MRKSLALFAVLAALLAGVALDQLFGHHTANTVINSAKAASSGDGAVSTPVLVLADGQRLDATTLGPIIEQYLLDHPELLVRVAAKLQEKQDAAAKVNNRNVLAAVKQDLISDPAAPVLGNPQGDVTVVEFFDYKCPYCKRVADDLSNLILSDPKVRVVFKEFPILGPDSQIAALGGLAANRQGKYSVYHKLAMEHHGTFSQDVVLQIAKDASLDLDKFAADMKDDALLAEIKKNQDLAQKLEIDGTPAFIIGNEMVPGAIGLDDMKRLVDEARKSGS